MIADRQIFLGTSQSNAEEEMYKELFIGLTENTLPETVIIPADVTNIGRSYWLISSTCKDITFLADSITASNNSVAYSNNNLTKVRLPNITEYKSWGFVSNQGSSHLDLYIPKCRRFSDAIYMFDTPANKTIGIHIDELTCAEIMNIPNFPGLHSSAYGRATFYGSNGSISHDGTSWVITLNA